MKVLLARIYVSESDAIHQQILERLHDEEQVKGVTMFRAVAGYGSSGVVHANSLVDLSLNLPIVIEFFDTPEKVHEVIDNLDGLVKPDHVVIFEGEAY